MFNSASDHFIAYVWHPQRIGPEVMKAAQETSSRAIFDLTSVHAEHYARQLKAVAATEVKISIYDFMNPSLTDLLVHSGIQTIWVEYHPAIHDIDLESFLARVSDLGSRCACMPILGDVQLLQKLCRQERLPSALTLKGSEAAGFVSPESIAILYAATRRFLADQAQPIDLVIWGGLATPEAASAFLATGARGVVFESLHWLTDLGAEDRQKEFLVRILPEHTSVVGSPLGVHCRVFNKGNSTAVREADTYVRSLISDPVSANQCQALASYLDQSLVSALESEGRKEELIPLGPEAAFSSWFAERFGRSTKQALGNFQAEINRLLAEAPQLAQKFNRSSAAAVLGTRYPFIQGAMTWITDKPEFAACVAEAGGLPTIALGLRTLGQLQEDLHQLHEMLGARPYAVNLMALPENTYLADQLTWIKETSPPFVAIAAGPPALAIQLRQEGLETIYITADIGLMNLALEGGVRWVVLEGNEAGGHVGAHSSLTLAQMALEQRWRRPDLFQDRYLVLAGGVYNHETAIRASMLGFDGLQMGTAYLATEDIVATGALTPFYRNIIVSSQPGTTVVSGESIGFRVRSLPNAKMEAILALEREYLSGQEDEAAFRHRLESESAKSLFQAARGLDQPDGAVLDEASCWEQGQFMSGAVGGLIERVVSVKELHRELAEGSLDRSLRAGSGQPVAVPVPPRQNNGRERVAITGMALVNALGNSPQEMWQAALAMKSGVTGIPASKWDHSIIFHPTPGVPEKTYCQAGAFINIQLSRQELGIPPQDFRTMATSTRLTMYLANQAIMASGILASDIPRERIAVIISQNSGESANTLSDLVISLSAPKIVHALRGLVPLTPDLEIMAEKLIKSGKLTVDDTTLLGRLNSAAGGFISNKYGFQGPCFSVSAACATGLVAIHTAMQMIYSGTIDAAIVGGGEEYLTPAHFIEFSALGALAGISGAQLLPEELSRPFDRGRDGFVLGEGGGMIVLERESLAVQRGARINAFITGVGASNNDLGMVESVAATQRLALQASFAGLPYGPETIDMVECHATGTVQGDIEEVRALEGFFPKDKKTILTSFKSQIGHCLGASGLNSMIRGIQSLQNGVFPGTLNYHEPDPEIDLEGKGFVVPAQPLDWPRPANQPRRLMVNAFGFGGANFVVHLEEALTDTDPMLVSLPDLSKTTEPTETAVIEGVSCFRANLGGSLCRVGVVASDDQEAKKKIATLTPLKSPFSAKSQRALAQNGIFTSPEADSPAPLALIFAGQGTFYPGMGRELYKDFPLVREWMDRVAALADFNLLELLFHSQEEELKKTLWQQPALFTLEYGLVKLLLALGVQPAALAGHSMGELTALCVAGVFSFEDAFHIINKRAQCMDRAGSLNQDPGAMIAVDVPMDILQEKVQACQNVYFTNFNSPRQVILGGATEEILALKEEIAREGYWTVQLRVSMAFHSPIMKPICDELAEFISTIEMHPPRIPVISNTTQKPYPDDPGEIRRIIMAHLENPVHWMQNVQTLWDDFGIRTFVEVGPKDTLCNLIADTIEGAKCLRTSYPDLESASCRAALAELFALGHLSPPQPPALVDFPCLAPVQSPISTPALPEQAVSPSLGAIAAVVQKEINSFVLETFGKFLKPTILAALRRDVDPAFSEIQLEEVLHQLTGANTAVLLPEPGMPLGTAAPSLTTAGPVTLQPMEESIDPGDYVEQVIRIIMDATGYERQEIEPQMDIRTDLAIRSSRLPIIMDAAERQFGIQVKVEDFIGLRTVQELADRIALVKERDGSPGPAMVQGAEALPPLGSKVVPLAEMPGASQVKDLQRLIFQEVPLAPPVLKPIEKTFDGEIAIFSFAGESALTEAVAEFVKNKVSASSLILDMSGEYDLLSASGIDKVVSRMNASDGLAGLILLFDSSGEARLPDMESIPPFLTGFFSSLQNFLRLPAKKFCLALEKDLNPNSAVAVASEGLAGMFLDAALEYDSVLFRHVSLDQAADLDQALTRALCQDDSLMQIKFHGQEAFGIEARPGLVVSNGGPDVSLHSGDVVIVSGGAQGISPHLALALAPFSPHVVLLGRSAFDPFLDFQKFQSSGVISKEAIRNWVTDHKPDLDDQQRAAEASTIRSTLTIRQTLEEFSRLGLAATYYRCDVTDPENVKEVMAEVVSRFGRINGLIHGAGILRDALVDFMSPEDFSRVVKVKLSGAWNLYKAACQHGLQFFFMLSSVAAVQGNVGQINYCTGNRAMSALTRVISARHPEIKVKALMLPPVDGVGMAANNELKDLMKRRGWDDAYIQINELTALFTRELFLGPPAETWVMFIRNLPQVKTTRLSLEGRESGKKYLTTAGVAFPGYELPMIQVIHRLDLDQGILEAGRVFSTEHDIWVNDHRPFKFLKNPFISGIMAIETFIEAAHLLYPHLQPLGIRRVEYKDIVECPPGIARDTIIVCRRLETNGSFSNELHCEVALSSPDITGTGRVLDRWSTNYVGEVILGNGSDPLNLLPNFAITPEEIETPPMSAEEVDRFYKKYSNMGVRYKMIETLDGAGKGLVRGQMVYKQINDFADFNGTKYQYSPYLLEAIKHLVNCYLLLWDEDTFQAMIPYQIGEMRFSRHCQPGEPITLEGRVSSSGDGHIWDAQAVDSSGTPIMQVRELVVKPFNE